jgi:hypothetical protein
MLVHCFTVGSEVSHECSGMKDDRMAVSFSQSVVVGGELHDSFACTDKFLDWQAQCAIHIRHATVTTSRLELGQSQE